MSAEIITTRYGQLLHREPGEPPFPYRVWRFIGQDKTHTEACLPLLPGERMLLSTRLHWLVPCNSLIRSGVVMPAALLLSAALDYATIGLWWLQAVLWGATAAHQVRIGNRILNWRAELIVVTTKRLLRVRGVFDRTIDDINLSRVTNIQVRHNILGRLLGFSQLRIESGGQHDDGATREYIRFVPNADAVYYAARVGDSLDSAYAQYYKSERG